MEIAGFLQNVAVISSLSRKPKIMYPIVFWAGCIITLMVNSDRKKVPSIVSVYKVYFYCFCKASLPTLATWLVAI